MDNCNLKWIFISVCILIVLIGLYLAFVREKKNIRIGNRDLQDGTGNLKEGSFNLKFAIGIILVVIGLFGALYCLKNIPGCETASTVTVNPSIDISHLCSATASNSLTTNPPQMAIDGDKSTSWNSGKFPSQFIKLSVPESFLIDSVLLFADQSLHTTHTQSPNGNTDETFTSHTLSIQTSQNLNWDIKHVFNDNTRHDQKLIYIPPQPLANIQFIKIETTESKSWVAWQEIQVFGHASK